MNRRPTHGPVPPDPPSELLRRGPPAAAVATDQADIVQPFWVSGGARRFYPYADEAYGVGQRNGIQIVASVYVPFGKIGFIKALRVAPLCPSVFSDPWITSGVLLNTPVLDTAWWPRASWRVSANAAGGQESDYFPEIWHSPFGWEGMAQNREGTIRYPARWTWQLSYISGTLDQIRQSRNLPPFSASDLASYYLVPDVPAEFDASYGGAVPGGLAGVIMPPQRYQVIDSNAIGPHIPIPENTTACLFARWTQDVVSIGFRATDETGGVTGGTYAVGTDGETETYPLGPSVGQMVGYMQPVRSKGSVQNAVYGWGG